jgi:hypothetical protein
VLLVGRLSNRWVRPRCPRVGCGERAVRSADVLRSTPAGAGFRVTS